MPRIEKPESRLFHLITPDAYQKAYRQLEKLRLKYPTYRDDELLMYASACVIQALGAGICIEPPQQIVEMDMASKCPEDCPAAFDPTCKDHRPKELALKQYGGAMGGGKTYVLEKPVGHQEQAKSLAPICNDGGIYTGRRVPSALCSGCGQTRGSHLRAEACPAHGTVPGDVAAAGAQCNGRSHACPEGARAAAAQGKR